MKMPSQPFPQIAVLTHGMVAATLLFAFGEQEGLDLAVGSMYLSSDLFYLPGVLFSGLVTFALAGTVGGACALIARVRPGFKATAAALAMMAPLVLYLGAFSLPSSTVSLISGAYGGRILGQVLSFLSIALTVAAVVTVIARLLFRNAGRMPSPIRVIMVGSVLGLIVAGLFHRQLFESYTTLPLVYLWAMALPLILGLVLSRALSRLSTHGLMRVARTGLAAGAGLALVSLTRQYGPDGFTGWGAVVIAGVLAALGYAVLSRGSRPVREALSAPLVLVMLVGMPVADIAIRSLRIGKASPGQHVFLFTVDTLRRDALSIYNSETPATPNIDALLSDGVMFTHAWSPASWTLPPLASIHTGVPPLVHNTGAIQSKLPEGWETLAEQFKDRGYVTEAIVFNPLLVPDRGLNQGFDRYWFFPEFATKLNLGQRLARYFGLERYEPYGSVSGMSELATLRLLRNRGKQYFVWLHVFDPHSPYVPPERHWPEGVPRGRDHTPADKFELPDAEAREWAEAAYLGEVQYLDECVGRVRDRLQRAGLYDDSIFIFTSDHGEEFWEKDRWGHGNEPTDTQVYMPLGIKPSGNAPGETTDRLTSTFEIMRMLNGLLDRSRDGANPSGSNSAMFLSSLPPEEEMPEGIFTSSHIKTTVHAEAIVFGEEPLKYVYDRLNDAEELYDLRADPSETRTLIDEQPELLEQGRRLYQAHLDYGQEKRVNVEAEPEIDLPDEIMDELKAHGYLE